MLSVPARYWNGVARHARHPVWRRLFSMDADGMHAERVRLEKDLLKRGASQVVVHAYLDVAPLFHECAAAELLHDKLGRPGQRPLAAQSVDEATSLALDDYFVHMNIRDDELTELRTFLLQSPEQFLPAVPPEEQEQAWLDESESADFQNAVDWSLADSVELPDELLIYEDAVEADESFDDTLETWLNDVVHAPIIALALEQCCDVGVLVDPAEATTRLAFAPEFLRHFMAHFWADCPHHVAVHLAHHAYWFVRAERGRRCGWPDWTPRFPVPAQKASGAGR